MASESRGVALERCERWWLRTGNRGGTDLFLGSGDAPLALGWLQQAVQSDSLPLERALGDVAHLSGGPRQEESGGLCLLERWPHPCLSWLLLCPSWLYPWRLWLTVRGVWFQRPWYWPLRGFPWSSIVASHCYLRVDVLGIGGGSPSRSLWRAKSASRICYTSGFSFLLQWSSGTTPRGFFLREGGKVALSLTQLVPPVAFLGRSGGSRLQHW